MILPNHAAGAVLGLIAFAAIVGAGEKGDPARKPLTAAQCEKLVEQLVNPGKRPFKDDYVHELPKGAEFSSLGRTQKPIAAAYDALSSNIEASLPILMKHINDERFSYVHEVFVNGVFQTANVSAASYILVVQHVEVYRKAVTKHDGEGRSQSLDFIHDECGGIEKWWKKRKGRPLAELQREGIDWALKQPRPEYFTAKEWAAAKKALKAMAAEIRDTKKAIRVEHTVQFFSK